MDTSGDVKAGKRASRRARGARKLADDAQKLAIEKAEAAGLDLSAVVPGVYYVGGLSEACCAHSLHWFGEPVDQELFDRQAAAPAVAIDPELQKLIPFSADADRTIR